MKALVAFSFNRIYIIPLFCGWLSLFAGSVTAQCTDAPALTFHSPVLLSGTDGQVGAIYNFANVIPGVDAYVEISGIFGGATLYNIDDSTGIGYYDAFQPYVGAAANDTSYIEWKFTFKKSGTANDTMLSCLSVTGVDVDGDASALKEFVEAATPGSFSVDPLTNLTVSFDGVRSKAISPIANIPLIDTNRLEGMFQMNFTNISHLDYRNGAITTGGAQVRQTCIYFKPFFNTFILLPATLLSFTARSFDDAVELKWSATDEANLKYYTLQRSNNGRSWTDIGNISLQQSNGINNYLVNDFSHISAATYYRLMLVSIDGNTSFSSIVKIEPDNTGSRTFSHNTFFNNNIRLFNTAAKKEVYSIEVYSISGTLLSQQKQMMHEGMNTTVINMRSSIVAGIYLLVIKNDNGHDLYHSKLIKTN